MSIILLSGYLKAVKAYRHDPALGSLFLTYIVTCAFYNITEAGFRIMTLSWISLLLAVVGATGIAMGVIRSEKRESRAWRAATCRMTAGNNAPLHAGSAPAPVTRSCDLT